MLRGYKYTVACGRHADRRSGMATDAPARSGTAPSGLHERADARPKRQREVSRGRGFGPLGAYIREENPSYRIRELLYISIYYYVLLSITRNYYILLRRRTLLRSLVVPQKQGKPFPETFKTLPKRPPKTLLKRLPQIIPRK